MRSGASFILALLVAGCSSFKSGIVDDAGAAADADPQGENPDGAPPGDAGGSDTGTPGATVTTLITARSQLGARSEDGARWRSGLAAFGDKVFWVEGGASPGLYAAPKTACAGASCVERVAPLTRAAGFAANGGEMYVADVAVIKRFPFLGGGPFAVATGTQEISNLAAGPSAAFWTEGTAPAIHRTYVGQGTVTLTEATGTPVSMGTGAERLYWAGVDATGNSGAIQYINMDGKGPGELSRFTDGFHTLRGDGAHLFYAKDRPATVHRVTLQPYRDDVVGIEAPNVTDFAVDEHHAYWVEAGDAPDYANGRLRRVAHDSRSPQTLAVSLARPVAVAVSGRAVFVANAGTPASNYSDGTILRVDVSD